MSFLINSETKVIVQGITGHHGSFHAQQMLEYGTKVIGGVTPGKGGHEVNGIPVFDSVNQSQQQEKADYSIIFVPADFALDAAMEAMAEGLNLVVITEGIPVYDVLKIRREAAKKNLIVIGPNCPGIITPGKSKIGIMPGQFFKPGTVGVLSRSGTLTYQISKNLMDAGIGQSTVIGIGGDMINGFGFIEGLTMMEKDPDTEIIVLIGEIGGDAEEKAAEFIKKNINKPVVAYIAGRTAPEGKTMGHAGAIISGKSGTFSTKVDALKAAGVKVAELPESVAGLI